MNRLQTKLKELRLLEGYKQYYVAEKNNLSKSYLSKLENGRKDVLLETYICILDFLGYELTITKKEKVEKVMENVNHNKENSIINEKIEKLSLLLKEKELLNLDDFIQNGLEFAKEPRGEEELLYIVGHLLITDISFLKILDSEIENHLSKNDEHNYDFGDVYFDWKDDLCKYLSITEDELYDCNTVFFCEYTKEGKPITIESSFTEFTTTIYNTHDIDNIDESFGNKIVDISLLEYNIDTILNELESGLSKLDNLLDSETLEKVKTLTKGGYRLGHKINIESTIDMVVGYYIDHKKERLNK